MVGYMGFIAKLQEKRINKMTEAFKRSGVMRYFHYDFGTMSEGMTSYTLTEIDGNVQLIYQLTSMKDGAEDRKDIELELTVMNRLKALILNEQIFLWNGFNKSNSVIATGNSFNLKADFDNYKFKASGMVMLPPLYEEKHTLLVEFLNDLITK